MHRKPTMFPLQSLLTLMRWTSLRTISWRSTLVLLQVQQRHVTIASVLSPRRETSQLGQLLHSAFAWRTQLMGVTTCSARPLHHLLATLQRKVAADARPRTCKPWARLPAPQLAEA